MTFSQFDEFQKNLLAEVVAMRGTKAQEYANSTDRLANFHRLAVQLDIPARQIGWVYLAKHLDAIASFCKTGKSFSQEGIRGRLVDAITYLTLIAALIAEEGDHNDGKPQPFEYDPTPPSR